MPGQTSLAAKDQMRIANVEFLKKDAKHGERPHRNPIPMSSLALRRLPTARKSTKRVSMPMPLPCITILVHGVNDVGEAYRRRKKGLARA